jgi:F-type H+-transporting ATPase subunit b
MPEALTELLMDAHFWVGVAFVLFVLLMFRVGVHKMAWNALGESGRKVQAQLDEAASLRAEAAALLENIKVERAAAERHAAEMLAAAKEEAERLGVEARVKLAEQIERRGKMAERKIAQAEAQAEADVRGAAAELATQMAEQVLVQRLAATTSDPLVDKALGQLAGKLQ